MNYFATHAGKGVLFIAGAALVLAVPIALPWITAVALLQMGVNHLSLAFQETHHDHSDRPCVVADSPALPPPADGERGIAGAGHAALRARP
jgi:hypothetical protein